MWRYTIIAILAVLITTSAFAILVGEPNPPLNRREVVTQGGGLGSWINIDTLIGNGTVTVVSFGYDT
ncbi:MAG: hypothetical protein GY771_09065 [bacterium]|nr:hypothetical protein [bacterium]